MSRNVYEHLNLNIPMHLRGLTDAVKSEAQKRGQSASALVCALIVRELRKTGAWPK